MPWGSFLDARLTSLGSAAVHFFFDSPLLAPLHPPVLGLTFFVFCLSWVAWESTLKGGVLSGCGCLPVFFPPVLITVPSPNVSQLFLVVFVI